MAKIKDIGKQIWLQNNDTKIKKISYRIPSPSTKRQYDLISNNSNDNTTDKATVSELNIFHDQTQSPQQKLNRIFFKSFNAVEPRKINVANPTYVANGKMNNTINEGTDNPT